VQARFLKEPYRSIGVETFSWTCFHRAVDLSSKGGPDSAKRVASITSQITLECNVTNNLHRERRKPIVHMDVQRLNYTVQSSFSA